MTWVIFSFHLLCHKKRDDKIFKTICCFGIDFSFCEWRDGAYNGLSYRASTTFKIFASSHDDDWLGFHADFWTGVSRYPAFLHESRRRRSLANDALVAGQ